MNFQIFIIFPFLYFLIIVVSFATKRDRYKKSKPNSDNSNEIDKTTTLFYSSKAEWINHLAIITDLRSAQDSVLWSIFGTFAATNAVLLVALFGADKFPPIYVGIIVCAVGMLLSGIWLLIQQRAIIRIIHYEKVLKTIELAIDMPTQLSFIPTKISLIPARNVMAISVWGGLVAWLGALEYFLLPNGIRLSFTTMIETYLSK